MADGASFSLMVGIGETYVPAFALALGLSEVAAGLIATLPMLAGGALQLVSPWAVRLLKSYRRWVVACAVIQAMSLLLMLLLAIASEVSPWLVFLPVTLYWATGLATGPAWNAWVEQLVPRSMRATYFAQRTRVSHVCVLLGLVAGGMILRAGTDGKWAVTVFAVLFGIAAASRLISAVMLACHSESPDELTLDPSGTSYKALLGGIQGRGGSQLVAYLVAVQVAVHLSAPYFTPYMLVQLKLSYIDYMLLLSCGFMGKIVALPWAGRLAKRAGASRLLWIGGISIVPLSGMWLISSSMPFLIILQLVAGMAWAAYELATLLLFFEAIPRDQRVRMLSLYNAGNAAAIAVGAVIGGLLIHWFADGRTAYLVTFGLSSLGRLVALLLIPRRPAEPDEIVPPVGLRTLAVRPMAGSIERPILSSTAGDTSV